jgi:hypothetical protein
MRTAIIPTMPSRLDYLRKAVVSIIDQVDMLYIYLNNFMHVPDFLLGNDKITNVINKDWGSAGRFFIADKIKGYLFFLDDDLIYPDDYTQKCIAKIEQYERKAIITLHGRIGLSTKKSFADAFMIGRKTWRCMLPVQVSLLTTPIPYKSV